MRTFSDVVYIIPEHPCVARVTALWLSPSHIFDMVPKGESHGMLFLMALFCCASNDILVAQCKQQQQPCWRSLQSSSLPQLVRRVHPVPHAKAALFYPPLQGLAAEALIGAHPDARERHHAAVPRPDQVVPPDGSRLGPRSSYTVILAPESIFSRCLTRSCSRLSPSSSSRDVRAANRFSSCDGTYFNRLICARASYVSTNCFWAYETGSERIAFSSILASIWSGNDKNPTSWRQTAQVTVQHAHMCVYTVLLPCADREIPGLPPPFWTLEDAISAFFTPSFQRFQLPSPEMPPSVVRSIDRSSTAATYASLYQPPPKPPKPPSLLPSPISLTVGDALKECVRGNIKYPTHGLGHMTKMAVVMIYNKSKLLFDRRGDGGDCILSSDQIRSDQTRSDQIRSDQIRSDQIRSDQIRSVS